MAELAVLLDGVERPPLLLGAEVLPEALEVLPHARVQVLVVLRAAVATADLEEVARDSACGSN